MLIAVADRSQVDDTIQRSRQAFEQWIKPREWPNKSAANFIMPMTTNKVFSIQTRLAPIYYKTYPFFTGRALDAEAEKVVAKEQSWLDYQIRRGPDFLNHKLFTCNTLALIDGFSAYKTTFEDKVRKRRFVQKEFDIEDGTWKNKMYKRDVPLSRRASGSIVEAKDIYLYPFNTREMDEAIQIWERFWMFGAAIERNIKQGNFYEQAQKLIYLTAAQRDVIDVRQSEQSATWDINPLLRPNELWYGICSISLKPDDGRIIEEELFEVIMHKDSGIICGIYPYSMDVISDTYHWFTVYERPNNMYGFTTPELLSQLNPLLNAIMNQWVNDGELRSQPPVLHQGDALINNKPIGPGQWIQVDSIDGIKVLDLGQSSQWPAEMKAFIEQYANELTGDFDISAGSPGKRKTKAEQDALTQILAIRTEMFAERAKQTLKGVANSHVRMEYLYGEQEQSIPKAMGNNLTDLKITKEELSANIDWEAAGAIRGYNEQEKQQVAMFTYELLMKNPLVAGSQVSPPNLPRIWQATFDLLEASGVKNIEARIGKKEEVEQLQQQMMMQQQQQMQQGQPGQGVPPQAQATLANLLGQGQQVISGQAA